MNNSVFTDAGVFGVLAHLLVDIGAEISVLSRAFAAMHGWNLKESSILVNLADGQTTVNKVKSTVSMKVVYGSW